MEIKRNLQCIFGQCLSIVLWTNIFGNQNKNEFQKNDHMLCYCGNAKYRSFSIFPLKSCTHSIPN